MDERSTMVLPAGHHTMFREGLAELLTFYGAWKWLGRRPTTRGPSPKERAPLIDGSRSRVFDQAEDRMHAWKALLYLLLG